MIAKVPLELLSLLCFDAQILLELLSCCLIILGHRRRSQNLPCHVNTAYSEVWCGYSNLANLWYFEHCSRRCLVLSDFNDSLWDFVAFELVRCPRKGSEAHDYWIHSLANSSSIFSQRQSEWLRIDVGVGGRYWEILKVSVIFLYCKARIPVRVLVKNWRNALIPPVHHRRGRCRKAFVKEDCLAIFFLLLSNKRLRSLYLWNKI